VGFAWHGDVDLRKRNYFRLPVFVCTGSGHQSRAVSLPEEAGRISRSGATLAVADHKPKLIPLHSHNPAALEMS